MAHLTLHELRGLGQAPTVEEQRAQWEATSTPRQGGGVFAAPVPQEVDQSVTTLNFPSLPGRQQRVSPLSVSWAFPVGQQSFETFQATQSRTNKLIAGGLILGGLAIAYFAVRGG